MLWYDFDSMSLEYRFTSYYPHGLIVVGVVYRKYWISFVNWWSVIFRGFISLIYEASYAVKDPRPSSYSGCAWAKINFYRWGF